MTSVEPITQDNIASSVSVEKKQLFVVHRKKKKKNSYCADITKTKKRENPNILIKCN